jgi:hypothetical protein
MSKICYRNLLETSTISLTTGTAEAAFPLFRLRDRFNDDIFKTTAAETTTVHIDQGADNNIAADRLFIPAGHNLGGTPPPGETLKIQYSDNNADWFDAVAPWVQSGDELINKSWTSITHRYWRFIVDSPAVKPEFSELFLTQTYTLERDFNQATGNLDDIFNSQNVITAAGHDRFVIRGIRRRQFNYRKDHGVTEAMRTSIETFNENWAGAYPFWFEAETDLWVFGKLTTRINLQEKTENIYRIEFNFLEVLG